MSQRHPHRGFVSWDGLGASISAACAVHCAVLPLIFGLLPGVQVALQSVNPNWQGIATFLLWTHEIERVVVSFVVGFATIVLIAGYLRHRVRSPLLVAGLASVAMIAGAFGHWHSHPWIHVALQVLGGLGIAIAHVLNLRQLHAVDPDHLSHSHRWSWSAAASEATR